MRLLLVSMLLVGALGCGRGGDDGSASEEDGIPGLTKQDLREIYENSPDLQTEWQDFSEKHPEKARWLREEVERGLPEDRSGAADLEDRDELPGASVGGRTPSEPPISQGAALWIGLALIGSTLFVAAIVWLICGIRDGFSGLERSERRMKRLYLERCERSREERTRGAWAP